MSQNTKIKEFIVDEHDVVNGLFSYSGALPVTAGTALTFVSTSGFRTNESDLETRAFTSTQTYANTVSTSWGVVPRVRNAGSGDAILGILRYDVRETDENGQRYQFYPQKWAENNWVASGQGIAIINKGFVFYSGVNTAGTVNAGNVAYVSGAAGSEQGELQIGTSVSTAELGRVWGGKGDSDYFLLQIDPSIS